jgi:hypothetical protein
VHISRAQRFPIKLPLRYREIGTTPWLKGSTVNISRTGVLFQAERDFPVQTVLEMRIRFPEAVVACRGPVVREQVPAFPETHQTQMAALIKDPMLIHIEMP